MDASMPKVTGWAAAVVMGFSSDFHVRIIFSLGPGAQPEPAAPEGRFRPERL
jgi:hypothetical protein